jgi:hypothetical protein
MVATRAEKRSAANSSNPLFDTGLLQNVLSYVGPGHSLFVAPVSWLWRGLYAKVESQQLAVYDEVNIENKIITCVPQMTLYSAVFASSSRVQLAHESGLDCTSEAYHFAAGRHADIAALATAHKLGMDYTEEIVIGAAKGNKLAEVQYLHRQGCPWPSQLLELAVMSGAFELVRWCYEHCCEFEIPEMASECAAASGNVELMAWILQQPETPWVSSRAMAAAAAGGHTAMCQFLHSKQCPWCADSTEAAARCGHADLLRWLMDNGCPWDNRNLYCAAANGGTIEVLAYLQQQGLLTSASVISDMLGSAACYGKLAVAKWLRAQGAAWPTTLRWWHSEVLAWARAEGCTSPEVSD